MGGSTIARQTMENFVILIGNCDQPVARFQDLVGHNTFLGGQNFCFYYMLNKFFWAQQNLGGTKEILGHCPRMHPRDYGPDCDVTIIKT